MITLVFGDWIGLLSYTGIGRWAGRNTSDYVMEWLTDIGDATVAQLADRIRDRGTRWLNRIEKDKRRSGLKRPRERHTFILAAFDGGPQLTIISNFEDCRGRNSSSAESTLEITTRKAGERPTTVATGAKHAVSRNARQRLKHLLRCAPDEPKRIRRLLIEMNREAATSHNGQGTISPECSVVSFRADGQGTCEADGAVHIRSMALGMAEPSLEKLAKLLGFNPGKVVQVAFGSPRPRIPYRTCKPRMVIPDDGSGYGIHELTREEFASRRAMDVNESGVVLGDGTLPDRFESFLWISPTAGEPCISQFSGTAGAINGELVAAATARTEDGYDRAVRWTSGTLADLGCYKGHDSGAVAINDNGLIVGWICVDPLNRGQINFRPAAWSAEKLSVLEDFGCDWGQAVDVNAAGIVLVVGYLGRRCRAIEWNPISGRFAVVGQSDGIYPTAITGENLVLGTARDREGRIVSCVAKPGSRWEPLGTAPGFHATAINDHGDLVGAVVQNGYERPWLRRSSGEIIRLPYFDHHGCRPRAINNSGWIVGTAHTDHGTHAVMWTP